MSTEETYKVSFFGESPKETEITYLNSIMFVFEVLVLFMACFLHQNDLFLQVIRLQACNSIINIISGLIVGFHIFICNLRYLKVSSYSTLYL